MTIWEFVALPWQELYIAKAMVGGVLVAAVCAVVGCFIVLRRMSFLGDALSHSMVAGVTCGYLVTKLLLGWQDANAAAMLLGALFAGLITVGLIGFVSATSRIKEDAAIGIMYTGIFAWGSLLASAFSQYITVDLSHLLVGNLLGLADDELWLMAGVCALVLSLVILLFRQLQMIAFDPVMAASLGVPVLLFDYLLTGCTCLVVVSAVPLVGVVLVVGLLITPAATAYLICDRLSRMLVWAALFAATSVVLGVYVAAWVNRISPAPTIVVMGTLQFLAVLCFAPRYGLVAERLRRRRHVPQQLVEDVLRCFGEDFDQRLERGSLIKRVQGPVDVVRRAVAELERREWLRSDGAWVALTEEGEHHARRLLRAHRLWEAYLHHVGMPTDELHSRAHTLEHVHDEATVDYLDDKLGHPLTDPHGANIPEDFVHLVPGKLLKAGLLRAGHRALVRGLSGAALNLPLQVGMSIRAGSRTADTNRWTFILPDGSELQLDHETADLILVELETSN